MNYTPQQTTALTQFALAYLLANWHEAIAADEIQMRLNSYNQPIVFSPIGDLKMTYLVMPLIVNQE